MAFNYRIEPEQQFIWLEWAGSFDLAAINAHTASMYDDPRYRPEYAGLCDARLAEFKLDQDGILKVQAFIASHPKHPTGPWAVICTEPLQTAYALIYENVENAVHPVKVFCTEEAALTWLREFSR